MTQAVRDVMTADIVRCESSATIRDVAKLMRDRDIGDVVITDNGRLRGIVTDRDIVVRCIADGADPKSAKAADVCSSDLTTGRPDMTIDEAASLMRDHAIRRLPIVDNGDVVGIVSLGDLAVEREPRSALGEISAARPNN